MLTHKTWILYCGDSRHKINPFMDLNYNSITLKNKQYDFIGTYSSHKVKLCLSHEKRSLLSSPLPILGQLYIDHNLIANILVDLISPGKYSCISLINGGIISLEKENPKKSISIMYIKLNGKKFLKIPSLRENNIKTTMEIFKEFFLSQLGRVASFIDYTEFMTLNIEEQIGVISMLPLYEFFIRKLFNESDIVPP